MLGILPSECLSTPFQTVSAENSRKSRSCTIRFIEDSLPCARLGVLLLLRHGSGGPYVMDRKKEQQGEREDDNRAADKRTMGLESTVNL
jgi:hypothetical protein